MAQLQLKPPDPFNFRTPDDCPRWRRRYEQFHIASGLSDADDVQQVNTLLYCIGEEAESVLSSTGITAEERKQYKSVIEEFFMRAAKRIAFIKIVIPQGVADKTMCRTID